MIQSLAKTWIILLIIYPPFLAYANYSISPVKLTITPEQKITSLSFQNNSDQEKIFQLTLYRLIRINGKEEYKETKDFIATPTIFKVKAGQLQLIRVAIKNNDKLKNSEKDYRLSIKELPKPISFGGNSGLIIIPDFRIPIAVKVREEKITK